MYITDLQTLIRRHGGIASDQELNWLYRNLHPEFRRQIKRTEFTDVLEFARAVREYELLRTEIEQAQEVIPATPRTAAYQAPTASSSAVNPTIVISPTVSLPTDCSPTVNSTTISSTEDCRPHISVTIPGGTVEALIDTGAVISYVGGRIARQWDLLGLPSTPVAPNLGKWRHPHYQTDIPGEDSDCRPSFSRVIWIPLT